MAETVLGTRPLVLHVACNLGSGVAAAIASYAAATPELEHVLMYDDDPSCPVDDLVVAMSGLITLEPGRLRRVRQIRAAVRSLGPDIVHAHSSFAGAYVRLAGTDRDTVVHTPHCYGFHRTDLSGPARVALWLAEAVLSYRGSYVAACSPMEYDSARRLPARRTVVYIPNAVAEPRSHPHGVDCGPPLVVAAGRLCPQKAPDLFAAAAVLARERATDLRFLWVGGGDPAYADGLRAAGVEVTGWLTHDAARELIARAQVYVHTAAWESAPLTVLEAASAGVPVLARDHRSLRMLGVRPRWTSVPELVDMLASYPSGAAFVEAAASGAHVAAAHKPAAQRAALLEVYARAGRSAGRRNPRLEAVAAARTLTRRPS